MIDLDKEFPRRINSKDYITAFIQKKFIEDNFNWLKVMVKNGSLFGKGSLKPSGCKNTYEIVLKYDPNSNGRKEKIFITNKKIKYGVTPHVYADNSLCLYYPDDLPKLVPLNFVDVIPWISKWLITYELWLKYGVWLDKEVKH